MTSRSFDPGAMAHMISRPGIDPRDWLFLGVVVEIGHDPKEGQFAEVRPVPTGPAVTCYIGTSYAGNNFGINAPLELGDTVLVAVPNGDTGNGPWIISRRWDKSDPPPTETAGENDEPTNDVVIKVKAGQRLVIIVDGDAANTVIDLRGGAKALIGPEGDTFPAAGAPRVDDEIKKIKQDLDALANVVNQQKLQFDVHLHPYAGAPSGALVTAPPNSAPVPTPATAFSFPQAPTAHTPESVACDQVEIY